MQYTLTEQKATNCGKTSNINLLNFNILFHYFSYNYLQKGKL